MIFHRLLTHLLQAASLLLWFQSKDVVSFHITPREQQLVSTRPLTTPIEQGTSWSSRSVPSPSTTSSLCAQDASSAPTDKKDEEKELTPETIAEMIEVSFLNSCLQLSQGYIDVLKLFIVAVKAGYERSMPLQELHQLVLDCPVNSAGRDLMKEEKELRLEWMKMVYEMLNALNPDLNVDSNDGSDNDTAMARITTVVNAMLSIQNELKNEENSTGGKQDANVALTTLTVEQAIECSPSLSELNESLNSNPMEKAFLTNDIRVGLVTFRVLEEEKICMQDSAGRSNSGSGDDNKGVPRPSIPGT